MDRYTSPDFCTAALITVDVQRDTLDGGPLEFASPTRLLPAINRIADAFRQAALPIIHVVRLYLPDGSNADLCRRSAIEQGPSILAPGTDGCELVRELPPAPEVSLATDLLLGGAMQQLGPNEFVMYKPRWGAFYGTPLDRFVQARRITTLVIVGCNFPNCPRATIYEATERDLRVVVATDAISRLDARGTSEVQDIGAVALSSHEIALELQDVPLR